MLRLRWEEPGAEERIAAILAGGGIVALPTETLYGLSCLATSGQAVSRLAALKGTSGGRGFVALVARFEAVQGFVVAERDARVDAFLRAVWPAPLTAVLRCGAGVAWGTADAEGATAAFRVPAHPALLRLLGRVGEPIVSTSANRSGMPPMDEVDEITAEFGAHLEAVVVEMRARPDGEARASTVADFTRWPPRVLRAGAFDLEAVLARWRA